MLFWVHWILKAQNWIWISGKVFFVLIEVAGAAL